VGGVRNLAQYSKKILVDFRIWSPITKKAEPFSDHASLPCQLNMNFLS